MIRWTVKIATSIFALSISTSLLLLNGCATTVTTGASNRPSSSGTKYMAPEAMSTLNTAGVESYDIQSACKSMVGKMLANPLLANASRPPQIILDSQYFSVRTSSRLDKDMLVDLLRTQLVGAANGRMIFVGREYAGMVENERALKRDGVVDTATTSAAAKTLGADYRLGGRITELTQVDSGRTEKYTQIVFEMVDQESAQIVFSDTYSFKKAQELGQAYR